MIYDKRFSFYEFRAAAFRKSLTPVTKIQIVRQTGKSGKQKTLIKVDGNQN